jgi:hypothetical protein
MKTRGAPELQVQDNSRPLIDANAKTRDSAIGRARNLLGVYTRQNWDAQQAFIIGLAH